MDKFLGPREFYNLIKSLGFEVEGLEELVYSLEYGRVEIIQPCLFITRGFSFQLLNGRVLGVYFYKDAWKNGKKDIVEYRWIQYVKALSGEWLKRFEVVEGKMIYYKKVDGFDDEYFIE